VFGPQKGATPEQVAVLDDALARFARVVDRDLGTDVTGSPAMGAAGGTAAGLVALLGPAAVSVVAGARLVCDLVALGEALTDADLVITGEGSLDEQTLRGKAPAEVAARARAAGVPCLALAGVVAPLVT
jgi:glycerate kinase